jgi:hypothetical protein
VGERGDHAGVKNLNLLTVVFENGILNSIMTTLVLLLSRSRAPNISAFVVIIIYIN